MIIDLSVKINEKTPAYPGDPPFSANQTGSLESNNCVDHEFKMGNHLGTHIDAPSHVVDGGARVDGFEVEQFIGKGRIIDVSDNDFSQEKFAQIAADEIIVLHTGMSEKYNQDEYFKKYPVMPVEISDLLVDIGIKMVAVDSCSVDAFGSFINHETLLRGNVLIAENLTNTEKLLGKSFRIYAFPLRLDLDGSPARVVAEIM